MEWISSILFLLGSIFFFISGWGLIRMPDVMSRLHAGAKGASLAMGLAMLAAAFHFRDAWSVTVSAITILFVFLTTPLAAHVLSKLVRKK